jgi:hypothetical protein
LIAHELHAAGDRVWWPSSVDPTSLLLLHPSLPVAIWVCVRADSQEGGRHVPEADGEPFEGRLVRVKSNSSVQRLDCRSGSNQ